MFTDGWTDDAKLIAPPPPRTFKGINLLLDEKLLSLREDRQTTLREYSSIKYSIRIQVFKVRTLDNEGWVL